MSRVPFIAGNWKLNLGPEEASLFASTLKSTIPPDHGCTLAVFPTTLSIPAVNRVLQDSPIAVGIQDVHWEYSGAYTGCNSAEMARLYGCEYALVGHSERRQFFHETDEQVAAKTLSSINAGLLPIVCVGESLSVREEHRHEEVVENQVRIALSGLSQDQVGSVTLAYEPIWAIGTGLTASPEQAQEVHKVMRTLLAEQFGESIAKSIRILYGGSVKAENAHLLISQDDIDGCLVGGASLNATAFAAIVSACKSEAV